MTPVFQTKFGGPDAPWEEQGDCHRAALASIFDVPISEVPEPNQENWYEPHVAWLAERGYDTTWHELSYPHPLRPGLVFRLDVSGFPQKAYRYALLGGKSIRGMDHVVVLDILSEAVVHDPHPSGAGILGVDDVQLFWERA